MPDREVDRLERLLEGLAGAVEFPPAPDLAAGIERRLEDHPVPARRGWDPRPLYAFAAVLLVLGLFFGLSPGARRAVAEWLGVPGVRIEVDPDATAPTATAEPVPLRLGERVSLAVARSRVNFPVSVPTVPPFERPDEVWFEEGRVHLVYRPRAGIPPSGVTDAGVLITQFRASLVEESLKKVLGTGTTVRFEEVAGAPAYWIEGDPHPVAYLDAEGRLTEEKLRLAANVLLWEKRGVTFRVESALDLQRALAVARSMR